MGIYSQMVFWSKPAGIMCFLLAWFGHELFSQLIAHVHRCVRALQNLIFLRRSLRFHSPFFLIIHILICPWCDNFYISCRVLANQLPKVGELTPKPPNPQRMGVNPPKPASGFGSQITNFFNQTPTEGLGVDSPKPTDPNGQEGILPAGRLRAHIWTVWNCSSKWVKSLEGINNK
jgi:hypothetical protein